MAWDSGSSSRRGYGAAWRRLRQQILQRDSGLCQACAREGRTAVAHAVDHIKAKASGGTDDPSNLEALCQRHHDAKTIRDRGHRPKPRIGLDGFPVDDA